MAWRRRQAKPAHPTKEPARVVLPLGPLVGHMTEALVRRHTSIVAQTDLLRARLADRSRDARIQPAPPDQVAAMLDALDAESLGRLSLVIAVLDLDEVRAVSPAVLGQGPILERIRECFVEFAFGTELLTRELLWQSPLRLEEFVRKWLEVLGVGVAEETVEESRQRLERLDYGRLLAESERAKLEAEPRLAALRALQEQRAQNAARRGKV